MDRVRAAGAPLFGEFASAETFEASAVDDEVPGASPVRVRLR